MAKKTAGSAVKQPPVRRADLLGLLLAALVTLHLSAQTVVTYPGGDSPGGIVSDGPNIWVTNSDSIGTVTKLLASTGALVGTYPVGAYPGGIAFDGTNIWVANSGGSNVTKLLASTGAFVGSYPAGADPGGVAFDGTNIWVASGSESIAFDGVNVWVASGSTVTKLLASTGALVGTYRAGSGVGVTKLLASTGATVGTYPLLVSPTGITFDGTNIWVAPTYELYSDFYNVTKLLASTGAIVGNYAAGANTVAVVFDGTNIWVLDTDGGGVTELLASTGAFVGSYQVSSGSLPPDAIFYSYGITFDGTNIWVAGAPNTLTKISDNPQVPLIFPAGTVPLYSTASTIQPGEWVSIWGEHLASGTAVWDGSFPTSLGGTSAKINGKAAYLSLASPGQINLQAPDDTATGTVVLVEVTTAGGSTTSTVKLAQFAPSFSLLDAMHVAGIILRSNGSGAYGGGAYDILGPTGSSLGYPTVAAKAGDTVELFGVGFGPTNPAVPAGQAFSSAAPTTNTVQLTINGRAVNPSFAGLSSAGLYQFNVAVPAGLGTGDKTLVATVAGVQTQPGVVIPLQ